MGVFSARMQAVRNQQFATTIGPKVGEVGLSGRYPRKVEFVFISQVAGCIWGSVIARIFSRQLNNPFAGGVPT
jgi:hypothetical protein